MSLRRGIFLSAFSGCLLWGVSLSGAGAAPARRGVPPQPPEKRFDIMEELKKSPFEFKREKYGKKRRDPFENPLTRLHPEAILPGLRISAWTESDQRKALRDAEALFKEIQTFAQAKQWKKAVRTNRKLEEILSRPFSIVFSDEVKSRRDRSSALRNQMIEAQRMVLYEDALEIVTKMNADFHDKSYEQTRVAFVQLQKLFPGMEFPPDIPLAKALYQRAEHLVRRSKVREELESKPLFVSGIVWTPAAQTAIVNDREVELGDLLPEGVTVKEITPATVVFQLEAETYAKGLSEGGPREAGKTGPTR